MGKMLSCVTLANFERVKAIRKEKHAKKLRGQVQCWIVSDLRGDSFFLGQKLPQLPLLDLLQCPSLTDNGLQSITAACPTQLWYLAYHAERVTASAILESTRHQIHRTPRHRLKLKCVSC